MQLRCVFGFDEQLIFGEEILFTNFIFFPVKSFFMNEYINRIHEAAFVKIGKLIDRTLEIFNIPNIELGLLVILISSSIFLMYCFNCILE